MKPNTYLHSKSVSILAMKYIHDKTITHFAADAKSQCNTAVTEPAILRERAVASRERLRRHSDEWYESGDAILASLLSLSYTRIFLSLPILSFIQLLLVWTDFVKTAFNSIDSERFCNLVMQDTENLNISCHYYNLLQLNTRRVIEVLLLKLGSLSFQY